jgi:hypothetical protein
MLESIKKIKPLIPLLFVFLLSCTNGNILNFLLAEQSLMDVAPVTSLTAVSQNSGIGISWTHSITPHLQSIEIKCSSGFSTIIPYNPGVTTFNLPSLTPHQAYTISVYAINTAGYRSPAVTTTQYAAAANDLWVTNAGINAVNGLYELLATPIGLFGSGNNILYTRLPNNNHHLAFDDQGPVHYFIYCEPPYTSYTEYYYTFGGVSGAYQVGGSGNSPSPVVSIIN